MTHRCPIVTGIDPGAQSEDYLAMANCYRCGRPIMDTKYHLRRRVKTGGYERRRYIRGRMDTVQIHFGMRVVCTKCAHAIDRQEHRLRFEGHLQVIIALLVMVIVLLIAR